MNDSATTNTKRAAKKRNAFRDCGRFAMAPRLLNMYRLKKGATFADLFPMDLLDVMWQAFEKDKLESITLELSRNDERIRMLVVETKKKPREP